MVRRPYRGVPSLSALSDRCEPRTALCNTGQKRPSLAIPGFSGVPGRSPESGTKSTQFGEKRAIGAELAVADGALRQPGIATTNHSGLACRSVLGTRRLPERSPLPPGRQESRLVHGTNHAGGLRPTVVVSRAGSGRTSPESWGQGRSTILDPFH